MIFIIMSRLKLNPTELKSKVSIRINPRLNELIEEEQSNKSKYIEWLIYQDLLNKKLIDKNFII